MKKYVLNILLFFYFLNLLILVISCSSPTEPQGEDEFLGQLEADVAHAILKPDGTVWAWGNNGTGQLGNGTLISSSIPVQVFNLKNIVAIDLCEGAGVAADREGNIWFWGDRLIWDEPPELDTIVTVPKKISYLKGAISVEFGGTDIDLLRDDGTVWRLEWCHWSPTKYINPQKLSGLNNIKAISGQLALDKDGTVCFLDDEWVPPEWGGFIPGIKNVKAIQNRSRTHTVILKNDGTVWAWGRNGSGVLGNGTFDESSIPVQTKNLHDIVAISAKGARCLALQKDGTVWFWGLIELDLDQNIKILQNTPLQIENLDNVELIFAGAAIKSIVKKTDGTYWVFDFKNLSPKKINFP
jgi:alpha-tubulin suppressor-like RCC1 family protein